MSAGSSFHVAAPRCAVCRHFDNAPESLERALPGLKVMGSGYGAARAADGLCERHGRYLSSAYRCESFVSRWTSSAPGG